MFKKRTQQVGFNPEKDWLIILLISFGILCIVVAYNIYVFKSISSGTFMQSSAENVITQTLEKNTLTKAAGIINTKKQKFDAILNGERDIEDPSL